MVKKRKVRKPIVYKVDGVNYTKGTKIYSVCADVDDSEYDKTGKITAYCTEYVFTIDRIRNIRNDSWSDAKTLTAYLTWDKYPNDYTQGVPLGAMGWRGYTKSLSASLRHARNFAQTQYAKCMVKTFPNEIAHMFDDEESLMLYVDTLRKARKRVVSMCNRKLSNAMNKVKNNDTYH